MRASSKAVGEFIVFIDDDVVPEPQLLEEHARSHHEAGRDVVVLGPLLTPEGFEMAPWVRWEQEMLMKQYQGHVRGDWPATARQFYTGNASLRRSQFWLPAASTKAFAAPRMLNSHIGLPTRASNLFSTSGGRHAFCRA